MRQPQRLMRFEGLVLRLGQHNMLRLWDCPELLEMADVERVQHVLHLALQLNHSCLVVPEKHSF